jgi:hypothetical protein
MHTASSMDLCHATDAFWHSNVWSLHWRMPIAHALSQHTGTDGFRCDCLQVIADDALGLLFKNKNDRKVLNVDPKSNPGDNSTRTEVYDDSYMQVVLFDHVTRRRN